MKEIARFDKWLTAIVQSMPDWAKPLMLAVTLCGSTIPILVFLGLGYLSSNTGIKRSFAFIAAAILLNIALKQFLHRPRPDTLYVSLMRFKTHSFPSGHAFGSITTYGFISYLALANLNLALGLIFAAAIWVLIVLIGVSRVYLGAHYPTDVIGGWLLGSACLCVAIAID